MHHRVKVEIAWLQALSEAGFAEIKPFSAAANELLNNIAARFSDEDAARIKAIEAVTNHDVKAIEYFLKEKFATNKVLSQHKEYLHFSCTSEDINNLAYSVMLNAAREKVMMPALVKAGAAIGAVACSRGVRAVLVRMWSMRRPWFLRKARLR